MTMIKFMQYNWRQTDIQSVQVYNTNMKSLGYWRFEVKEVKDKEDGMVVGAGLCVPFWPICGGGAVVCRARELEEADDGKRIVSQPIAK